jgi:hypothetical protein
MSLLTQQVASLPYSYPVKLVFFEIKTTSHQLLCELLAVRSDTLKIAAVNNIADINLMTPLFDAIHFMPTMTVAEVQGLALPAYIKTTLIDFSNNPSVFMAMPAQIQKCIIGYVTPNNIALITNLPLTIKTAIINQNSYCEAIQALPKRVKIELGYGVTVEQIAQLKSGMEVTAIHPETPYKIILKLKEKNISIQQQSNSVLMPA